MGWMLPSHIWVVCSPIMHGLDVPQSCMVGCSPIMHELDAPQWCMGWMLPSHAWVGCSPIMHGLGAPQSCMGWSISPRRSISPRLTELINHGKSHTSTKKASACVTTLQTAHCIYLVWRIDLEHTNIIFCSNEIPARSQRYPDLT